MIKFFYSIFLVSNIVECELIFWKILEEIFLWVVFATLVSSSWNQCTTNSLQSFKKNLKKSGSFTISLTYITVSPVENLFLWETIRDRELAWWKLFADRKLLSKTVLRHFLLHFIDRQHSLWTETRERRGDFFGNY